MILEFLLVWSFRVNAVFRSRDRVFLFAICSIVHRSLWILDTLLYSSLFRPRVLCLFSSRRLSLVARQAETTNPHFGKAVKLFITEQRTAMKNVTIFLIILLLTATLPRAHSLLGKPIATGQKSKYPQYSPFLSTQLRRPGTNSHSLPKQTTSGSGRRSTRRFHVGLFAKTDRTANEDGNANGSSAVENFERTQRDIDAMMRDQDNASMQSTLFGLNTLNDGDTSDDDDAYNAVPLFTGSLVLLASLFFTGYGFFVFFTGDDPIFLNQQPTAPPPESWYNQGTP